MLWDVLEGFANEVGESVDGVPESFRRAIANIGVDGLA